MVEDQRYRQYMNTDAKSREALDSLWALQGRLDSLNVVFIEQVFKAKGYPGESTVGKPANETAWYIIQHSEKIKQYFPMMKEAGEKGELPQRLVAMMEDRLLTEDDKEQVYGTQATSIPAFDSAGHQTGVKGYVIWPIKDPEHVNERRKKAGFAETVEQNAKDMGIEYKKMTMEELRATRQAIIYRQP